MTIAELYAWAKENGVEDYPVEIQHADDGGYYSGTRDLNQSELSVETREYGDVVVL